MKENRNIKYHLANFLQQLFVQPHSHPPFLQYFITFFEFLTFVIFVASASLESSLIFPNVIQRNLILFLIALLILRYLTKISLIKSIYVMILAWNLQSNLGSSGIIVYLLLLVNIVIDIITKLQFSFQTKNLHSSTHPWIINVHYLIIVIITCLRFCNNGKTYLVPIAQFVGFFLMILLQYRSIAKYSNFRTLHIRFYFLCCFYAFGQLFDLYIAKHLFAKNILCICLSQLLYQFVQWKSKTQFTVQQYISKKMELQAGFYIFSYLHSKNPLTKNLVKSLKTLSSQDGNCLIEQKTFKQSMMNTRRGTIQNTGFIKQNDTREACYRLIQILKQKPSFYSQLFIAQLSLYQLGQHLTCHHMLNSLYKKSSWYNIFNRILISKIQKKLFAELQIEHNKRISPNFYEFIQNDKFRNILLKSALDFITLWQYTKVKQGIYKRINQLSQKVIISQQKIKNFYTNIKTKCIQINLLYGNYLFYVQRNTLLANQIMENLYFYQQREENLQCDSKIYIKLSIQKNQEVKISGIGCNVNKHLGYERRVLTGMSINTLIPQFFKENHNNLIQEVLNYQTHRLALFRKNTIIKNAKGGYQTILLCLRLTVNPQKQLFMQGFIKIVSDKQHNWQNYLFIKNQTKQIIECSMTVNDKISQGKNKKFIADDFFDNIQKQYYKKIQTYTTDLNRYIYEPITSFQTQEGKVTLFVQLDPYSRNIQERVENDNKIGTKCQLLIPQMISYPKYKVFQNIKYFLRKKVSTIQNLETIHKRLIVFLGIIFMMIVGIYVLEGVSILNISRQYDNKIQTMVMTDNIVKHYMGLGKIGVDLSYLVVKQYYGFVFPEFNISLKQSIMTVQQTNQYFKPYSLTQWEYQSLSSITQMRTCYEFISQVLASASFIQQIPYNEPISSNMISAFNELFTQTFVWSYAQYTTRIQQLLAKNIQNRDTTQIISIVILIVLCIILYIILFKVQSESRVSQYETLKFIGSISFQDQVIQQCQQFISKITDEKIQNLINKKAINYGLNKQILNDGMKLNSQMSARQTTGRQLMGNMSARQTPKQTWRTATNPPSQPNSQHKQFPIKLRPMNKVFIFVPLILILIIISFQISNYLLNIKNKQINEAQSSKNIVEWMNKPLFFTRLVNAFLTEDRGPQFTDHDKSYYRAYKLFQASYNNIATFDELNYPQFSQFEQKLRKIRFQYLCTYANCPAKDKDYLNILYTTTMQKLANYMQANQYFLNDTNNKIDTVLIAQQMFREIMTDLIQTYIRNYKQYASNYKSNQLLFMGIILISLTILFVAVSLQVYFKVYKSLDKHFKICNIIKQQSYLINKEALKTFEQEQNEKIKNQNKMKQLNKKKNKGNKDAIGSLEQNKSQIIEQNQSKIVKKKVKSPISNINDKQRKVSIFNQLENVVKNMK